MPDINESQTREQLIDQALGRAGWDVSNANQVGIEVPVDGSDGARGPAAGAARGRGIICLIPCCSEIIKA